jgi:hypothetical protein
MEREVFLPSVDGRISSMLLYDVTEDVELAGHDL